MFRSLWFKLVVAFVAIILVTLVIVLSVIIRATDRELGRFALARTEFARSLIPTVPPFPTVLPIPTTPPVPTVPSVPTVPPVPTLSFDEIIVQDGERIVIVPPVVGDQIVREIILEAAQGGTTGHQFLADVRRTAVIAVVAAGMAAILFMTLIFRQITRPLTRLRLTTQAFAQGDLNARVPIQSNDEVGKVADAFNQMASQLQRNEQARQQMVADVAHELRTPLSVMQSNIEAMMDGLLEPNPDELAELHGEVGRLARMVEDLRLLSLADAGQLQLTLAPLDASKLIERVVGLMTPMAEAHAVNLKSNVPLLPVILHGDKDKLQQALTNLIDNAVRHAPTGGQVTVGVAHTKQAVFISVADNGPGISAADLPHVFERFWRSDKSRSRHSGGSGLGLSIVKQMAELHGGTVQAVSPESEGTQFTIALPLKGN